MDRRSRPWCGVSIEVSIDRYYLDTIEDLVNRVHTIRDKERRFGVCCVDRWREQRVELRCEADRLLARLAAFQY
jgi:hypothetical protein